MKRYSTLCCLFLCSLFIIGVCGKDADVEEGAGDDDEGVKISVETETDIDTKTKSMSSAGDDKDKTEKNDENKDDDELPKTIMIDGREVEIERADRTITATVTFEISFGTERIGNVTFGMFGRTCPKTVRNFVTLANRNRPTGEGYKGSKIHRIVKGFAWQGGDFLHNDGSGGWSIFGRYFRDENFAIKHFPFCISMANSGSNSNASQFFVPMIRTSWLDGKHVVFGQIIKGHKTAKKVNDVKVNAYDRPYRQVWISDTWTDVYKKETSRTKEL